MHYVVYGGELSYFTRKLEAALRFYGADFELRRKDASNAANIEARAGTHQVPVLHTPENWMIADTTPLLHLLDERFPQRRLFPDGPLGVLCQIVEEYFDEWIARTMVHYRWHYPDSAAFASTRMAHSDAAVAARLRDWGPRACRATGTDSPHQQQAAEAEYLRILQAIDGQLATTAYLLGDRPTAVDCIVLGGLRAHTYMDPDPKRVTQGFARMSTGANAAPTVGTAAASSRRFLPRRHSPVSCSTKCAVPISRMRSATRRRSAPARKPSTWTPTARTPATCLGRIRNCRGR
jgi:glutathione S-transferase